ncbi:uncharacterized protein LOC110101216 [Dendrobium catenatum]|uniref:uncharacterized protein LOC110101216 n=1 Tax=Dendrobium catenatum TaxID=906689 RepID=UPI0009F64676|nr:uncharacterized protein LOC110101216 [Dendrobium catenatum]
MEAKNSQILKNSVVIKVLGNNVPFSVCSTELRRQWSKFSGFYLTSIAFDLNTFKGVSALVWIRLTCLLLYCWYEDNIARIASCLGTLMYIDGNTFRWGKWKFARVCVRIDLEKKLMNGVWVDGSTGRFFQQVEYEKIDLLCYQCGSVGHDRKICPENVTIGIQDQALRETDGVNENSEKVVSDSKTSMIRFEYGPWIHVQFKNRRGNREGIKVVDEKVADLGKTVLVLGVYSETENSVGDKNSDTILTNRFAVLGDSIEEECMGNHAEVYKTEEGGLEIMDPNVNNSNVSNFKLSKKLRSLGPDESNYKKKKRDGSLTVPILGTWRVATVYGSRYCKERGSLWKQLQKCIEDTIPSIIGGAFNCINNKEEKRGGKRFLFSKGPREMKSFMVNSDFHDIGSVGPRVASDHSPIVLNMRDKVQFKAKTFKFEDTWRSYPAAKSIEKLKKEILNLQNKEALGDNWSSGDLLVLRNKVHELNVILRRLSTWWNQRAKVRWHEEGDTNSMFFHNFASARKNGNRINQIKDEFNIIHDEEDQIEKVFTQFFEKKWKYRECELTGWQLVDENQKVSEEDMVMLNEDFSVNELQLLVFQQGNNKALGIDGVTSSFYKSYWSILWETLWSAINRFFKSSIMNREWKDTLIA